MAMQQPRGGPARQRGGQHSSLCRAPRQAGRFTADSRLGALCFLHSPLPGPPSVTRTMRPGRKKCTQCCGCCMAARTTASCSSRSCLPALYSSAAASVAAVMAVDSAGRQGRQGSVRVWREAARQTAAGKERDLGPRPSRRDQAGSGRGGAAAAALRKAVGIGPPPGAGRAGCHPFTGIDTPLSPTALNRLEPALELRQLPLVLELQGRKKVQAGLAHRRCVCCG